MKTIALVRIAAGLFFALAPLAAAQAKEDGTRCRCWYIGWDEYKVNEGKNSCKEPPPLSEANACDRDATQKKMWIDGCVAHADNEPRKCPYKTASD